VAKRPSSKHRNIQVSCAISSMFPEVSLTANKLQRVVSTRICKLLMKDNSDLADAVSPGDTICRDEKAYAHASQVVPALCLRLRGILRSFTCCRALKLRWTLLGRPSCTLAFQDKTAAGFARNYDYL